MSDTVAEHVDRALASLADVPVRELKATAEALERRRDRLGDFAGVFREVAWSRESDSTRRLARFHLRHAVERGGCELSERIGHAEAPFWGHVRDALRARTSWRTELRP